MGGIVKQVRALYRRAGGPIPVGMRPSVGFIRCWSGALRGWCRLSFGLGGDVGAERLGRLAGFVDGVGVVAAMVWWV